ncbi:MAG: hypothetical protein WC464_01970 [Bdellovibrionales bacterium]
MSELRQIYKPGVEEWVHAAEVLSDRLSECVHVYKHNVDVFMSEAERQQKTDTTIKVLQRLHTFLDQSEMPAEYVSNTQKHDEQIISGFEILFREALRMLPWLSNDMQKLLKSPWMKNFPSKVAETMFFGGEEEMNGIGSGLPEHGRLPAVLSSLLEREQIGETRPARQEPLLSEEHPRRHDVEGSVRWAQQNSGYLRTAGKVE